MNLSQAAIDECFVASMMTIIDETKSQKYNYLNYVEWKEMLCRVALIGLDPDVFVEPIAFKVQFVLEHLWTICYKNKLFKKGLNEFKLFKVSH